MFQGEEVAIFLFDHYFKGIDNVGRKKAGFKMGRGAFIESLNSTAICLALTTIHFCNGDSSEVRPRLEIRAQATAMSSTPTIDEGDRKGKNEEGEDANGN